MYIQMSEFMNTYFLVFLYFCIRRVETDLHIFQKMFSTIVELLNFNTFRRRHHHHHHQSLYCQSFSNY